MPNRNVLIEYFYTSGNLTGKATVDYKRYADS